jgi:hypothetical protein
LLLVTKAVRPLTLAIIFFCLHPVETWAADPPGKISASVDRAFRPLLKEYDVAAASADYLRERIIARPTLATTRGRNVGSARRLVILLPI